MARRHWKQSQIESFGPEERTAERLAEMPRRELERFYRDFVSAKAWRAIRDMSREDLMAAILKDWRENWDDAEEIADPARYQTGMDLATVVDRERREAQQDYDAAIRAARFEWR